MAPASKEDINGIVKSRTVIGAAAPDGVLLKLSVSVVRYLAGVMGHGISRSCFSDGASSVLVGPVCGGAGGVREIGVQ